MPIERMNERDADDFQVEVTERIDDLITSFRSRHPQVSEAAIETHLAEFAINLFPNLR